MKKIKLLTSLTSLGLVGVATPIVATSCSENNVWSLLVGIETIHDDGEAANNIVYAGGGSNNVGSARKITAVPFCEDYSRFMALQNIGVKFDLSIKSSDSDIIFVSLDESGSFAYAYSPKNAKAGKATITISLSFADVTDNGKQVSLEKTIEIESVNNDIFEIRQNQKNVECHGGQAKVTFNSKSYKYDASLLYFKNINPGENAEGHGTITAITVKETSNNITVSEFVEDQYEVGKWISNIAQVEGKVLDLFHPAYFIIELTIQVKAAEGEQDRQVKIVETINVTV